MDTLDVVAIVGSLRRHSLTMRLVAAMQPIASSCLSLDIVPLHALTLYNEDDDLGSPPPPWVEFRDRVRRADAVLFATPEYNRSVPGVLKNAVDIGSRPYGASVWSGKPAAILSTSPGQMGGFGANHHLRQSLMYLNMPTLQQPECYLGYANSLLDGAGGFVHRATRDHLQDFIDHFASWIHRQLKLA